MITILANKPLQIPKICVLFFQVRSTRRMLDGQAQKKKSIAAAVRHLYISHAIRLPHTHCRQLKIIILNLR